MTIQHIQTIEDHPQFGKVLQLKINQLSGTEAFETRLAALAGIDPEMAEILAQEPLRVSIGGSTVDLGPHGQVEQCLNALVLDVAFIQSYQQINPIESICQESLQETIRSNCRAGSTLPNSLVILARRTTQSRTNEYTRSRALRLAKDMSSVLNLDLDPSYLEVLSQGIDRTVASKGA